MIKLLREIVGVAVMLWLCIEGSRFAWLLGARGGEMFASVLIMAAVAFLLYLVISGDLEKQS